MPPRRGPGAWGRLRPVEQDPLDVYGLPSKGETRLLDFKTQERYYTKIIDRYLAFCTEANGRDGLLERFSSLEAGDAAKAEPAAPASGTRSRVMPSASVVPAKADASKELSAVLMALRKLREAIVATERADDFSVQAYLFCIRLAVLVRQPEAYHPAILHLLRHMRHFHPLTTLEVQEVTAYLVLDAACRRSDLAEAFRLRCIYRLRHPTVDAVLAALAREDWIAFRRLLDRVDGHQARLLAFAEDDLRMHTLKCFGRAYLRLEDVTYLETATGMLWPDLQTKCGVGWVREEDAVIIRSVRPKKPVVETA